MVTWCAWLSRAVGYAAGRCRPRWAWCSRRPGSTGAFDRTYGVSAGALNGCALAVGQAALSATPYQDAASRGVINRLRPLMGRSVIDFELLFEQLIAARKPLSFDGLASGPEFRALATSLETLSLRVLAGGSPTLTS